MCLFLAHFILNNYWFYGIYKHAKRNFNKKEEIDENEKALLNEDSKIEGNDEFNGIERQKYNGV